MDIRVIDDNWTNGSKKYICLFPDSHIDPEGDNTRLVADLSEAVDRGADILFGGDIIDGIYTGDPRYARSRDKGDYDAKLNMATEYIYELLRPFVNNIVRIPAGNHEESVLKHYHYDVTRGIITLLNRDRDKKKYPIIQGGYRGLINYRFRHKKSGGAVLQYTIYQHHGTGSGGKNGGMLKLNDLIASVEGVDLVAQGHIHRATVHDGVPKLRVTRDGRLSYRLVKGIVSPGHHRSLIEDQLENGHSLIYEDKFSTPTPQGYGEIELTFKNGKIDAQIRNIVR